MKKSWWDSFDSWELAEREWDERAKEASLLFPLDIPSHNPSIPHISPETSRLLRLKGLLWVLRHDKERKLLAFLFQKPFVYFFRYVKSLFRGPSLFKEGDLFFYGMKNLHEMQELMRERDSVLFVGFSYCEKPKSCPLERFSSACSADENNPVCRQCFIGKVRHALPRPRTIFSVVPTINAVGEEISKAIVQNPGKKILFLIASCEMALTMFGDLGRMVGIQGIGVRLQGRVCNTMKAFALSERGIKPGMTWVSTDAEKEMLLFGSAVERALKTPLAAK